MLSKIQKLLLLQVFFIFTPFYLTGLYLVCLFFYFLYTKELIYSYKSFNSNKLVTVLVILSMFTSIIHKNMTGLTISIGFIFIFGIIMVYRSHVSKQLFYLVIKVATFMSLICAIVGFIQFIQINLVLDSHNIFQISDKPQFRVRSFFMNANYYATILEFVVLMAFYKLAIIKDKESSFAFYSLVIIINIFILYLTGCRTAWFVLFASIPIIFLFQKKYYLAFALLITSLFIFLGTIFFEIFPRIDTLLADFNTRMAIWETSFKGFIQNPILGVGPFGYKVIYLINKGPKTIHSHSLYLDVLLSYGIVGTTIILLGFKRYLKVLFSTSHLKYYGLMIGMLSVVLIHGFLDVTIMNLQVSLLFLFVLASVNYQDNYSIDSTQHIDF